MTEINNFLNLNSTTGANKVRADYQQEMLQDRFALAVTARLSDLADSASHEVSERLRVARQQALAKRKLAVGVRAASGAVASSSSGSAGSLTLGGGDDFNGWNRIASAFPLIALVIGLISITVIQNDLRANEVAEVDAALLLDDLPPNAYTDPGFAHFLKTRRDLAQ